MSKNSKLKLHIISAGSPNPNPQRYGSAFILEVGKEKIMVDCGPATTYKMVKMGIRPEEIEYVFFTHHHYDHNAGFPAFALTRCNVNIDTNSLLKVYGPEPTNSFIERLLGKKGAFFDDWNSRIEHKVSQESYQRKGGTLPRPAPASRVEQVEHGDVMDIGDLGKVTAAEVKHVDPYLTSMAYRFDIGQKSIVFLGDAADCEGLRSLAKNVDTIVLTCTFFGESIYSEVSTGTVEVARIASELEIKCVVLTHANKSFNRPGIKEKAVGEIAQKFNGEIIFPEELTTIKLME